MAYIVCQYLCVRPSARHINQLGGIKVSLSGASMDLQTSMLGQFAY